MDNPTLYNNVNLPQREAVESFLAEYLNLVTWNQNGGDVILDIGCGTGSVTCDVLLPMLPEEVKEILAMDVNSKMISTALECYSHIPKVKFEVMDIGADVPYELQQKFDHVFSFFCLHWLQDQRWVKYLADVQEFSLPYEDEENPSKKLKKNLENEEFNVELCEKQLKTYIFYDDQSLTNFMESINPFVKRMTENEKQEFMEYFIDQVKLKDPNKIKNTVTRNYYSMLVAYAHKQLNFKTA